MGPALGAADGKGASTWSIDSALEQLSIDGEWTEDQARVVIQAVLKGLDRDADRPIVATSVRQAIQVSRDQVRQQIALRLDALRGQLKEAALALTGEGVIREVTGAGLRAWSVRQETDGARSLVLGFEEGPEPRRSCSGKVSIETAVPALPSRVVPLSLTPEPAALFHGFVRVDVEGTLTAEPTEATGLIGIDRKYLPVDFLALAETAAEPLAYRFQGTSYALPLKISVGDPEARRVVLNDFRSEERRVGKECRSRW